MKLIKLISGGLLLLSLSGCAYGTYTSYGGAQGSGEPRLPGDWQDCQGSRQASCYQFYGP